MECQSVEHGARYLRCQYSRVMEALGWLKRNNPLYEDVIINGVTEDMFDDEDDGNGSGNGSGEPERLRFRPWSTFRYVC